LEGRYKEDHGLRTTQAKKKKVVRPHLNKYLDLVVHTCHLSYARSVTRWIMVQDSLDIKQNLSSKIINIKNLKTFLKRHKKGKTQKEKCIQTYTYISCINTHVYIHIHIP
jgi:hypothetical protein